MNHKEVQKLSLSEYINIIMSEKDVTFGEVFRKISDYYTVTHNETESHIISALWELVENDKVFDK